MNAREEALRPIDRLDDQRTFPRQQRQALRPASTIVRVWINEPATDVPPWATMSTSQKPGTGLVPVIERANRDLTPNRRIESGTAPPAAARRDLHIDKQAINGGGTDSQNTITVRLAKLQPAMLLKGRQQGRNHNLEPLAAHPIRRLLQRRQRILDRRAISASSLSCCLDLARTNRLASPQRAPHACDASPTSRTARRGFVPSPLVWPTGNAPLPPTLPRAARPY
jgi:hypothetical protein